MRRLTDRQTLTALVGLPPLALAVLLLALAPRPEAAPPALGYPDLPAVAHTGGFGELTCQACHFGDDFNEPGGHLSVEGWPETTEPGTSYPLTVRLEHPDMERAGFQLTIRTEDGDQAGTLDSGDARSSVTESSGISYLHHTLEGTELTDPGTASWEFTWTAPDKPAKVRLHLSANAANGDDSAFGDLIYADSLSAEIASPK